MYIPKQITLIKFLSHKHTVYNYKSGFSVIQGINLDVDNEESNGSGKSGLLEAELFCLTSLSAREVVLADLIMDGEDSASVQFILYETKSKQELKVTRNIFLKKSSNLEIVFIKEGVEQSPEEFATITDGNNLLLNILGISQIDLINFFLISKEKYKSFYKSSDTNKKEIIARFSGSDLLEGIENIIEDDLREPNKLKKEYEDNILRIQGSIDTYNSELENLDESVFNEKRDKDIKNIEENIGNNIDLIEEKKKEKETIRLNIIEEEKKKQKKNEEKTNKEQEILNLKTLSPKESELIGYNNENKLIDKKVEEKKLLIVETNKSIRETNKFISDSEASIAGEISCPHCKKTFILGNENIDVEAVKETIREAKEEILIPLQRDVEDIEGEIEIIKLEYETVKKKKLDYTVRLNKSEEEIRLKEREKTSINNEISTIENSITTYNNNITLKDKLIKSYEQNIEDLKEQIEELKKSNINTKIKEIKDKIKEKEKEKIEIEDKQKQLVEEIFEKSKWNVILLNFKSWLATKAIKNIEGQTNYILSQMNSELQVKIEGMTMLADGKTMRDKISTTILRNGLPAGSLGKFSGGEKGKIEVATILAFQKMLNLSCPTGGLDLMTIDEVLESISRRGMTKLINSLQNLHSNIKLITHVYLDKDFPDITETVVKENGISQLL